MLAVTRNIGLALLLIRAALAAEPPGSGMSVIAGGVYRPAFRAKADAKEIPLNAFALDILPVTNSDFLEFVRANPRWQRSRVKRIFADESYLKNWAGDLELGANAPSDVPVTSVSWFAAKAYAQWKGKRLPTVAEWEYAAAASPSRPDGDKDVNFKRQVLEWYSTPTSTLRPVGAGQKNYWGVADLHGLVWEWVSDFNTAMVSGDSRSGLDSRFFCGAGAQNAVDRQDFAAFMRYGFRSSLKAAYTVHNLGFRCAKDLKP
jgi:formylglycine-generating enzyme required for sulfatase activity